MTLDLEGTLDANAPKDLFHQFANISALEAVEVSIRQVQEQVPINGIVSGGLKSQQYVSNRIGIRYSVRGIARPDSRSLCTLLQESPCNLKAVYLC